jgi:hypothetical protein
VGGILRIHRGLEPNNHPQYKHFLRQNEALAITKPQSVGGSRSRLPTRFPGGRCWEARIQVMPDFIGERGGTRTLDPMIKSHDHANIRPSSLRSSRVQKWDRLIGQCAGACPSPLAAGSVTPRSAPLGGNTPPRGVFKALSEPKTPCRLPGAGWRGQRPKTHHERRQPVSQGAGHLIWVPIMPKAKGK